MYHSITVNTRASPRPQLKEGPYDPALAVDIAPSPHPNPARFSPWVSVTAGVAAQLVRLVFSLAGPWRALGPSASSLLEQSERREVLVVGLAQEETWAFCS